MRPRPFACSVLRLLGPWAFLWIHFNGTPLAAQGEDFLREQGLHGFALEAGEVALPRLEPGSRVLLHRAVVEIPDAGRYRFHLEVTGGSAELKLTPSKGQVLRTSGSTEWLEFEWTELQLELRFETDGSERQRLRILWEREMTREGGFLPEPLPHDAWRPVDGLARIDGMPDRLLLEQKGCTNCHLPSERSIQALGQRPAPDLTRAGSRLGSQWMRRWIENPAHLRAEADMPSLFGAHESADLEAVVAYLGAQGRSEEQLPAASPASEAAVLDQGRELYHALGCVACHSALEPLARVFGDSTLSRKLPAAKPVAPFGDLEGKWRPGALSRFLQDPEALYPDGRMPAMGLSASEADLLANYLVSLWGAPRDPAPDPNPELERRGLAVFEAKGCAACHLTEELAIPPAKHLEQLRGRAGCLDPAHDQSPNYDLPEAQRRALERAIVSASAASGAPAPLDAARRSLANLNCFACHAQDGQGGPEEELLPFFQVGDERVDLGDEGRLPPDLSGVGWRLTRNWLREVLLGERRARPYMRVRMPAFGEQHVGQLPDLLARMEGLWPGSDLESPEVSDSEVLVGRELMGRTALSCVTCHSFGDLEPLGSPGPALDQFGERLRYEWARSFLRAPQRFKPGSRMPDFYAAGKSTLHTVYEGDLGRQVDAMWAYFGLGEFMPPPPGMEAGRGLQVLVDERPVVLRSFLEGSGSRAIAVGNPHGAHYAFDAEKVCLSEVWQGDFVDASGSWSGRGGSTLGGMGEGLWSAGEGVPLQLFSASRGRGNRMPPPGGAEGGLRFRGYRLDPEGNPSFLYEAQGKPVVERVEIERLPELKLLRRFQITGPGLTGITLNALESSKPRPRFRFDGGDWVRPSALQSMDGRAYFHQVIPESALSIEIELELRP